MSSTARPRKSSCTHVVTRMCRVCGVHMLPLLEPDAYARPLQRVCSSRVTLKYPKIRNPNPNPAVRTESAEYGHAFSYSSRFQTRTACILVLCIVHHRTLVGSGHHSNTCGQVDWQRCWACAHSVDLYCLWAVGGATPLRPLTLVLCAQH